jgi:sugar lactone lactonase YvrE
MKKNKWIAASAAVAAGAVVLARAAARRVSALAQVFADENFQITGVTISKRGRLFVNYPRWSDLYLNAVVEVLPDGSTRPFPDERWNGWDRKPHTAGDHFVCVQSVVVDDRDQLWVLDAAAPMLTSPVPGGAKLVRVDLASNAVVQSIAFGPEVIRADSYLNDVRVDVNSQTAYITDSGAGGIVVVELSTGRSRRTLDGHPSVMAQDGVQIVIEGKPVLDAQGQPPKFNSDGIALSTDGTWLYYQPITATTMYRIRTEVLRDANAPAAAVGAAVERYADTFPVDGLWIDAHDRIYLTDITHTAVSVLRPDRTIERLVVDRRLQWPDTFTQGPDGAMYVTASHINESATYNRGKSTRVGPYAVFKLDPAA